MSAEGSMDLDCGKTSECDVKDADYINIGNTEKPQTKSGAGILHAAKLRVRAFHVPREQDVRGYGSSPVRTRPCR